LSISSPTKPSAIGPLLEVSARIGRNPHLVQAATGNTSLKRDGELWIKASGKWLADAIRDEIFFSLDLADTLNRIDIGIDPSDQPGWAETSLRPSVETAMHAVLPFRVVLHVHSVNTIAWAVREDGPAELARRLEGIAWQWVPYTPSGLPLARAVKAAVARAPGTRVLILANHGLVIGGETCEEAESLLFEVERRTEVAARRVSEPDWEVLTRITGESAWRLPEAPEIHAFGTDPTVHRIVRGGILYPCQRIFLTPRARSFSADVDGNEIRCLDEPFVIINKAGTLLRKGLGAAELAILVGLAEILLRIPESAPVRYLSGAEIQDLSSANVYNYTELSQRQVVSESFGTALP
jgi:rhamnose utilization protein RhaD (predicted bifunctional aldolase and dehydrogenase)